MVQKLCGAKFPCAWKDASLSVYESSKLKLFYTILKNNPGVFCRPGSIQVTNSPWRKRNWTKKVLCLNANSKNSNPQFVWAQIILPWMVRFWQDFDKTKKQDNAICIQLSFIGQSWCNGKETLENYTLSWCALGPNRSVRKITPVTQYKEILLPAISRGNRCALINCQTILTTSIRSFRFCLFSLFLISGLPFSALSIINYTEFEATCVLEKMLSNLENLLWRNMDRRRARVRKSPINHSF